MASRADFYLGRGPTAKWLGSISFDGYPEGNPSKHGVVSANDEARYVAAVNACLEACSGHSTRPEDGWPWPWNDSTGSDWAYAFEDGTVWASNFGDPWGRASDPDGGQEPRPVFPNMKAIRNVTLGPRSGLIIGVAREQC